MTSQLPPRETDHYTQLLDATVVTTRALLTARENITDTIDARAMMCLHGPAGVGKTLAANVCLRDLERTRSEEVCRITFRARPTARSVRHELFNTLGLSGEPPRHPSEFDRLLLDVLAAQPRTLVVDEAQWLNRETFEYFRFLWDHHYTQIAIIFAGGEGAHSVLRKEPMLSSRIFIWQHVTKLTLEEVQLVIPLYHPVWAQTDPVDITYADRHAAHGNFRNWARLTAHVITALERTGRGHPDQEVLRWAFSRLG
ncbi:AAA family ATPase [Streptomyces sp. NPDC057540]|uniref:AAA family ATPase n=1 Tax=Streptomyces sp. NPDC057540 TaxID=3346160 RepID=UPI0036CEC3A5